MRKIKSREEIEKSQRRNKLVMGWLIIFLMVFSTAGYAFFYGGGFFNGTGNESNQEDVTYTGQYWIYKSGGKEFYFTNQLENTQSISVETNLNANSYIGKPLFLAFENEEIINEISGNLGQYALRIQRACLGECEDDLPEKECSENLIIWKESEENKVYQQDNCVFIEGDLLAVDAFLFKVLGFN